MSEFISQLRTFKFESWQLLGLLALIPILAFLKGKLGSIPAVGFSSSELLRPVGLSTRNAPGRLIFFIRLLALALL
ncbi:MAG TPA: hypothetical protein PLW02_04430, partial [Verrucomicrobiota bacterium]|nr:hypothetical protein [Verrucomicrobiota bacterium]